MVGFARDEIEKRSRLGFCDIPLEGSFSLPLHTVLFLLVFI